MKKYYCKKHLTQNVVNNASYDRADGKQHIIWDTETTGFAIRLYPSGKKSFMIGYRIRGKWRMMTIGQHGILSTAQARKLAREKLYMVVQGIDPLKVKHEKDVAGSTMQELCGIYLAKHSRIHKKTWPEDERRIQQSILPAIGKRPVIGIVRQDIIKIHESVGERGHYEANRVLALVSSVFEFGRKHGFVTDNHPNPARGIQKYKETKRDRWVTPDELPALAVAIDRLDNIYIKAALWMYLLTGCRKNELLSLKWKDVDLNRREIRLAETKAGRTHYIHLSDPAIKVLENLPRQKDNPYVFCGRIHGQRLKEIGKAWQRVRKEAGLEDVRLHDLRRTVGSWLATSGHSLQVIGKVLNHSNPSTTQIYSHLSEDPIRRAMDEHGENILKFREIQKEKNKDAG